MDTQTLTYLLDQAVGVAIAILLITRIERRLDTLIEEINTLSKEIEAFEEKGGLPHGEPSR
ncbi:YvrJ family protein [Lacticaseibacillus jixianensis]|uniref:YvrJ family protein n=1 Tax=Lacticaseibacillus jixianensis TaxID=2486012 RepID=A0ABW4BBL7_9LACO|nr:YvrJ family protein [Lacticaseibacillus jixianensis]